MKLKVCKSVDYKTWDESICALGGTVFHSYLWATYIAHRYPHVTPRFATLISDNGEPLGAALVFLVYPRNRFLQPLVRHIWLNALPVAREKDEDILSEFLSELEEYARGIGAVELIIESAAFRGGSLALERSGFQLTKRLEFELNITRSEEHLWHAMQHSRRKNINKARRMGVCVQELVGREGIDQLRCVQAASSRRIVKGGGPSIVPNIDDKQDPALVLSNSEFGRLMGAKYNGVVVSAVLFTEQNTLKPEPCFVMLSFVLSHSKVHVSTSVLRSSTVTFT